MCLIRQSSDKFSERELSIKIHETQQVGANSE